MVVLLILTASTISITNIDNIIHVRIRTITHRMILVLLFALLANMLGRRTGKMWVSCKIQALIRQEIHPANPCGDLQVRVLVARDVHPMHGVPLLHPLVIQLCNCSPVCQWQCVATVFQGGHGRVGEPSEVRPNAQWPLYTRQNHASEGRDRVKRARRRLSIQRWKKLLPLLRAAEGHSLGVTITEKAKFNRGMLSHINVRQAII